MVDGPCSVPTTSNTILTFYLMLVTVFEQTFYFLSVIVTFFCWIILNEIHIYTDHIISTVLSTSLFFLANGAPTLFLTFSSRLKFVNFRMSARPVVSVYGSDGKPTGQNINLPAVFKAPIRPDVVTQVHTGLNKNNRQPYAVADNAGEQTSAESWGTGRAVSRIPRVRGGGTSRSG